MLAAQRIEITVEPLRKESFHSFGDVIETDGAERFETNGGDAIRFHDLAWVVTSAEDGRTAVSIFRSVRPADLPLRIRLMERHPISSQAFIPVTPAPFLVLVAPAAPPFSPHALRAFITNGRQGVNFHPAVWHHPLITLQEMDFLVIDRVGPGKGFDQDYEETLLTGLDVVLMQSGRKDTQALP